jgi:hypothetical protein
MVYKMSCAGIVFNQFVANFSHFLTNTHSCDLQMVECCAINVKDFEFIS